MDTIPFTRRRFLTSAAAVSAGFLGLRQFTGSPIAWAQSGPAGARASGLPAGYGPIVSDPKGVLDLPAGFTYRVLARMGDELDDGLLFGGVPDGAASFAGPDGLTVLIVNHELEPDWFRGSPFGRSNERLDQVPADRLYDAGTGRSPSLGGTTTLHYDTRTGKVVKRFASLLGTDRNCAGGPTPWGSWISCEETVRKAGQDGAQKDHGYCFEVPASATGPVAPVPLKAMGRFTHEAVAVDPASGAVYLTEDLHDGCFYRFLPDVPGQLAQGGRLQALALVEEASADVRNWLNGISDDEVAKSQSTAAHTLMKAGDQSEHATPVGKPMAVRWIDLDNVESPDDDLRYRAFEAGATRFARGEGIWFGRGSAFFACTSGGRNRAGQVFRYTPSPSEGLPAEADHPATLELFLEPNDTDLLENCDNVTVAPWGDLILCEDSKNTNDLVGVTPDGRGYRFGRNALSGSEFAGANFSPDGSTLFVCIQADGLVLGITGPWDRSAG
ncbi:MAG: alkaline phosphatase PhoX [Planctomycetota bacterium]